MSPLALVLLLPLTVVGAYDSCEPDDAQLLQRLPGAEGGQPYSKASHDWKEAAMTWKRAMSRAKAKLGKNKTEHESKAYSVAHLPDDVGSSSSDDSAQPEGGQPYSRASHNWKQSAMTWKRAMSRAKAKLGKSKTEHEPKAYSVAHLPSTDDSDDAGSSSPDVSAQLLQRLPGAEGGQPYSKASHDWKEAAMTWKRAMSRAKAKLGKNKTEHESKAYSVAHLPSDDVGSSSDDSAQSEGGQPYSRASHNWKQSAMTWKRAMSRAKAKLGKSKTENEPKAYSVAHLPSTDDSDDAGSSSSD
ncbi:unnamed protein product [Symbiodinium natans]|uniref:Uncharacterized protein n=1 Tax=Symbiodinium natans TaxID=878477 RepID=A0A812SEP7_9DINO|nr:unnamed protein product [Symbiodinium natans]